MTNLPNFEEAVLKEIKRRDLSVLHVEPTVLRKLLDLGYVEKRHIDGSEIVHSTSAKKIVVRITDAGRQYLGGQLG